MGRIDGQLRYGHLGWPCRDVQRRLRDVRGPALPSGVTNLLGDSLQPIVIQIDKDYSALICRKDTAYRFADSGRAAVMTATRPNSASPSRYGIEVPCAPFTTGSFCCQDRLPPLRRPSPRYRDRRPRRLRRPSTVPPRVCSCVIVRSESYRERNNPRKDGGSLHSEVLYRKRRRVDPQ